MQQRLQEKLDFIIQLCTEKFSNYKEIILAKVNFFWQCFLAKLQVALAVAKIQWQMRYTRVRKYALAVYEDVNTRVKDIYSQIHANAEAAINRADARARDCSYRMQKKYDAMRRTWRINQHYTFWLIPANGQHVTKTHVKKKHIKYAFTGVASFLVVVSITIGVLAHFAIQNENQKREIAEYKATKQEQEAKIQKLQKIAEDNQKQLAYLTKLEDKVRKEMAKNGTELPPKTDVSTFAGKGGPSLGDSSPVGYMLEQEKNIRNEAKARRTDMENLLSAIENENYRKEMTPSQWPTDGGEITSYFGGRANPFDGYSPDWHPGIDIANYYGAPVYASAAGYVAQSGWYGGYGRYIRINHDYGYVTAYGHMSRLAVSSGQYVEKGEIIGYVGSSGYSTGPHLHFELIRYGKQVNPLRYI